MAAVLGNIDKYDEGQEEWPQYVERFMQFLKANDIVGESKADKRRSVFLSVIGPGPYQLLRSLLAPAKPDDKTLEQLVEVLTKYYSPTPSEIVQRFRFHTRARQPGETVSSFVAELRKLAEHCNFGETLEKMLRDRLVCGINDPAIQKRLLAEESLTYTKALSIARSLEAADKDLSALADPTPKEPLVKREPVHKLNAAQPKDPVTCHRCGVPGHLAPACKHKDKVCHKCKKRGHLARVCTNRKQFTKKSTRPKRLGYVDDDDEESSDSEDNSREFVRTVGEEKGERSPPITVYVMLDGKQVCMEVDTGASVSLMSETSYHNLWPGRSLGSSNVRLMGYLREPIQVVGSTEVQIEYEGQTAQLPLVVVKGSGPTLMGRNWLHHVQLNWSKIHYMTNPNLHELLDKYSEVFKEELGTMQGFQARIEVDPEATPRYCKARTVPYALRQKVEAELDRLVAEGTLEPIDCSEWAAPIVPVLKSDRQTVRICGDFRTTVNPVSHLNRYPIPKVEDLFATLKKGKKFTKIDLSQAYQQLELDEDSKKYLVINTHKGLFRYTRLPYGVASAPGIFQKVMEQLLQGIAGVTVYIDDILITGKDDEEHLQALEEVLRRLAKANLRAKKPKCQFLAQSVSYLGHQIDASGLHPLPHKIKAIREAPTPTNVTELKSYLGLLTYYGKFLPNLSTRLAPLYHLLKHDTKWNWTPKEEAAFQSSKDLLTSSSVLIHFDPTLPILLQCDASQYGIGAVLAHRLPDGSEKPVGFASRTLNSAERNYSQLEKEGLACIFGVKRFFAYLFGHPFQLVTDHKPSLGLLRENKSTSPQASARIRRWSLYLSMFEYTLHFRNTTSHANADALSRLPLPKQPSASSVPPELVLLAEHLATSPITSQQIQAHTRTDPVLSQVVTFVKQGWPDTGQLNKDFTPFKKRKSELSVFDDCLLWGSRVVVPLPCQQAVLHQLHEGHPGIQKMKGLSRMYVWWPGISDDIERMVKTCTPCQLNQSAPPVAPLRPWSWPTRPFARLHIDYAGPVEGHMILVCIDAHSKWIEAVCTSGSTSAVVIEELRSIFARFGLPETIVSDNGTCFVSNEFESFLKANGIKHLTIAPYHPSSNGLAARAVQIVKHGLKKNKEGSLKTRLAKTLFTYRLSPQATTQATPAELLMNRRPRTRLDCFVQTQLTKLN